jgi:hypothetical protein
MAADNHQLEIYRKCLELILGDPDFHTVSGIQVGANNQIRVDSGKVKAVKKTAGQDGDVFELEFQIGEMRDDGDDGTEDDDRPTFAVTEGVECDDPHVIEYDFVAKLTYPNDKFEDFFPLVEVIRRDLRGYKLRAAGLAYAGNTSIIAEFDPAAEFRQTIRPQHTITITVPVEKN